MNNKLNLPGGKGDRNRSDSEKYRESFDRIFGKTKQDKQDYKNLADLQELPEMLKEQSI